MKNNNWIFHSIALIIIWYVVTGTVGLGSILASFGFAWIINSFYYTYTIKKREEEPPKKEEDPCPATT